jgi:hypothetical protein
LKIAGAIPFRPFGGEWVAVVVAFTDMVMSGGLGGQIGGIVGGAVGPNKAVTVSMDGVGFRTAGELRLWILWTLTAEWADAVLEPDDPDENPLGL